MFCGSIFVQCTKKMVDGRSPQGDTSPRQQTDILAHARREEEFSMSNGPQAFFDVSKLMKEFDPTKVVAEFSNALKQYKLPNVDLDSVVASQKKNLEALTAANRTAFEGLQAVAKRQAEILQETMNEASKAVDALAKAGSPAEVAAKQAELTKSAFERALSNMRELADLVAKSNQDASTTISSRISASLDEIKDYALKLKQPTA
jgi:phasin family protein